MFSPESLRDLPTIAIMGLIILVGIWFLSKSLLPSINFLTNEQAKAVQLQATAAKNAEDTYEKRLAANNELIKQQFITYNMERDQERNAQISKLKEEIGGLVRSVELGLGEIDTLKKRGAILDESNLTKDKQIESLLAQVENVTAELTKVTAELTNERDQNKGLRERVSSLELQIATLISPGTMIAPVTPPIVP